VEAAFAAPAVTPASGSTSCPATRGPGAYASRWGSPSMRSGPTSSSRPTVPAARSPSAASAGRRDLTDRCAGRAGLYSGGGDPPRGPRAPPGAANGVRPRRRWSMKLFGR